MLVVRSEFPSVLFSFRWANARGIIAPSSSFDGHLHTLVTSRHITGLRTRNHHISI